MAKRAFCIGINDYPYDGSDLKGCVNDANDWANLLVEHFDFPRSDVRLVTDSDATKSTIVEGVKDLLAGAKDGDRARLHQLVPRFLPRRPGPGRDEVRRDPLPVRHRAEPAGGR